MRNGNSKELTRVKRHAKQVEAAVQQAVRKALLEHKRKGESIVVVENGKIRDIPADKIKVPRARSR